MMDGEHTINERVIEIPWALAQIPQKGNILDIGSCGSLYLEVIHQPPLRELFCLDSRYCRKEIPAGVTFYHQSILGNNLPRSFFDAVLLLSTIEHVGLPCYGQKPVVYGDILAISEVWFLLKPGGRLVLTVPVGCVRVDSWYRQYSPATLKRLLYGWRCTFTYWGFDGSQYVPIGEDEVVKYDYRNRPFVGAGAGAVAGVVAYRS